jgi:hypothetical protein
MDQTVYQQPWPLKRVNRMPPMIADMHLPPARAAGAIHNVQIPTNQRWFRSPDVTHDGRFLTPPLAESDQITRNSKLRERQS